MTEDTDKEQTSQEEDVASFYMYSEMNEPHQMDSWLIIHGWFEWLILSLSLQITVKLPFMKALKFVFSRKDGVHR